MDPVWLRHTFFAMLELNLPVALALAVGSFIVVLGGIRLRDHLGGRVSSWATDLTRAVLIALPVSLLAFVSGTYFGVRDMTFCETANATDFSSPDGKNRLVVYSFDCSATDRSFEVSMLKAGEALPRYQSAVLLYSAPGTPVSAGDKQNFDVAWTSAKSVMVRIDAIADGQTGSRLADDDVRVGLAKRN